MLRIGIVDDHKLFRKSLGLLINSFEGMTVVIDAENGRIFLDSLATTAVDLVLLDIQMPEMNGYETCVALHRTHPEIMILIVSQLTTKESIHKIMELGANGYFTKNSDPDQLEYAIRSLHQNGYYFGMELGSVLREAMLWEKKFPSAPDISGNRLSAREVEILKMAAQEYSSGEIGVRLFITLRTVESHRKRIMQKTGAKNIVGAVLFAIKQRYFLLEEL